MTIATRSDELERQSGDRLANYPFTLADYYRLTRLRGLDRLRAVEYGPYRRACWDLHWICLAIHGPAGVEGDTSGDDWVPTDDDFDQPNRRIDPTVNGILRAEWDGFNKKMDDWARRRYQDTGVMVSDADKRAHTSRFAAICRKRYGHSYPEALQEAERSG